MFPTNKYKDHQNAPGLGLMVEYVKFNFNNATVKKASKRAVIIDMLENLYYIWTLFLVKLLLDTAEAALTSQGGIRSGTGRRQSSPKRPKTSWALSWPRKV